MLIIHFSHKIRIVLNPYSPLFSTCTLKTMRWTLARCFYHTYFCLRSEAYFQLDNSSVKLKTVRILFPGCALPRPPFHYSFSFNSTVSTILTTPKATPPFITFLPNSAYSPCTPYPIPLCQPTLKRAPSVPHILFVGAKPSIATELDVPSVSNATKPY